MSGSIAILCINLDGSRQRWALTRKAVVDTGLGELGQLFRVQATVGRQMSSRALARCTSALVRWNLQNRQRVCNHTVLNSVEAVGAYDSHRRCWQWLRDYQSTFSVALIIEDNVCFVDGVRPALQSILHITDAWDVVFLGYHNLYPFRYRRTEHHGFLRPDHTHWGAHCYALTAVGAAKLLERCYPYEMHVDFFLSTVSAMGFIRGYLLAVPVATQCNRWSERSIPHFDVRFINVKMALPNLRLHTVLIVLILFATITSLGRISKATCL